MVDRAVFPREKLCAGAICGGGLRELELAGLLLRVPHALATHAVVRHRGRAARVPLRRPAAVVRRIEFDADLVAQARAAGARVLEGTALLGLEGGFAATSSGPVACRALVAADGVGGPSRRLLGLPAGARAPLRETLLGAAQRDLLFDLEAGWPGYAWRFPCLEEGRAAQTGGVYAYARGADADRALRRFLHREEREGGSPGRWAIRLFEPRGPYGKGQALLAGDALGIDPLAGEGLRYALWSGRIAGRRAAEALARGRSPSVGGYRAELLRSRSGVVLVLATHLAKRLYGPDERYRRLATDRRVAEGLADLVSGEAPLGPLLRLLALAPGALLGLRPPSDAPGG